MSSLIQPKSKSGTKSTYRLSFYLPNQKRVQVRLGSNKKAAEGVQRHIDHLVASVKYGTLVSEETAAWLRSADRDLVQRLAGWGLCSAANEQTVSSFIDEYIRGRNGAAAATLAKLEQAKKSLVGFIGPETPLAAITKDDAKRYHKHLLTKSGLGRNSINRRMGFIRQFFTHAVEMDLIPSNPFALKSISTTVGAAKKPYVTTEDIQKLIDYCPELEWKLLFALARFAGCRIASEIKQLKWSDINWEQGKFLVHSPKTAYRGKTERFTPIFPEISSLLVEAFEKAKPGEVYVFPELRKISGHSTRARRLVLAAGLLPWPKMFNSLRASCQTDLCDKFGDRKACLWIGNTERIAAKHYNLLRDSDFLEAAGFTPEEGGAKSYPVGSGIEQNRHEKTPQKLANRALCGVSSGRYLTRTSDLHDVNVAL